MIFVFTIGSLYPINRERGYSNVLVGPLLTVVPQSGSRYRFWGMMAKGAQLAVAKWTKWSPLKEKIPNKRYFPAIQDLSRSLTKHCLFSRNHKDDGVKI